MALSLQQKKMKKIADLLSRDLGYIYGEKESGPNGAKKEFLNTAYTFLKKLAVDLNLNECAVKKNKAGIACSGEVTLKGMWSKDNGIFFELSQNLRNNELLFREITDMQDYTTHVNQYIKISVFQNADYSGLLDALLRVKKAPEQKEAENLEPEAITPEIVMPEVMEPEIMEPVSCDEKFYALETINAGAERMLYLINQMPEIKGKMDAQLQKGKKKKAKIYYDELQEMKKELEKELSALALSLVEAGEEESSSFALKLTAAIKGFNLLSPDYSKFCGTVQKFLQELPHKKQTVNAKIIGRLMNRVRMGYYPTDPDHIRHMVRAIEFPMETPSQLLDPCCGCGIALRTLAEGNNCFTYGIEIDEARAEEALSRLHRVGFGTFFNSRISHEVFNLVFLNPPYLSVLNGRGSRSRSERNFLIEILDYIMEDGLLIYIIPYYRLDEAICRILSHNFKNITVWKFYGKEFTQFKQVAVMGQKNKRQQNAQAQERLMDIPYSIETVQEMDRIPDNLYKLPACNKKVDLFKGSEFNVMELEEQLKNSESISNLYRWQPQALNEKQPLLPLNIGQIGLIGGSGLINGLVECEQPHIIKGNIIKVISKREEQDGNKTLIHETKSNKMIFNVLTPEGFKSLA